jgi:hypothetical protein
MLDGVPGKPQADHPIDLLLLVRELDIGAPRRQVGAPLLSKAVLRRDDQAGLVPVLAQRAHQLTRHHQVAAFGERRARRDHRNGGHLMARLLDAHGGRSVGTARIRWSRDDAGTDHIVDTLH